MKNQPTEVRKESNGEYHLNWTGSKGQQQVELWVDPNRGFSPTRMEARNALVSGKTTARRKPWTVNQVDWIERGETWVPSRFYLEQRLPRHQRDADGQINSDESVAKLEFTLEWESVNAELPPELFTVDGLKADRGTLIVNYMADAPIVERVVGVDDPRVLDVLNRPPSPDIIPVNGFGPWRLLFIALNIAFIIALLFLLWQRRVKAAP
jgi:hypothetical protein